jgi:chromosome segregation ATPase
VQKNITDGNLWKELSRLKLEKVKVAELYRKREIAADRLKFWKEEYANATKRFTEALKNEREHRDAWLEKKDEWKKACKNSTSAECKELEAATVERAKEYLDKSVSVMIEHLNQIKAKVESADTISDEQADEIISVIEARIEELENILDEVEKADTKEEVKAAVQDLDAVWKRTRWNAVAFVAHILNTRVDSVITKSEKLEDRLNCALAEMKEAGKDTSAVEAKVEEFSGLVQDAKDDWKEARDLYTEIIGLAKDNENGSSNEEIKDKAEEMKSLGESSRDKLKDAHELLVEITKDIKASGVDLTGCDAKDPELASDEEYVVEESG